MKKYFSSLIIITALYIPKLTLAQSNSTLIPCTGTNEDPCGFPQLMLLIANVIHFLLVDMATPIAAIVFAYAGWLYMTSGISESKSHAKSMMIKVVIGYVLALASWLIVKTIMVALGYDETNFQSFY